MSSKTPGRNPTPHPTSNSAPGALSAPANTDSPSYDDIQPTAPATPSPHLLSPAHQRFCAAYVSTPDLNATKAYQVIYPSASYDSARSEASRLLANPNIRREIQRLMDERAEVTGITADRVLLRLWHMATADPRELAEVNITCCRHCWGMYHQWQYTDSELEHAENDHVHAEAKRRKKEGEKFEAREFHSKGGGGFDAGRKPHPECPECAGRGQAVQLVKDTRDLSPGAVMIFGGTKVDKNGNVQVLIRDQLPALKLVCEHLGVGNVEFGPFGKGRGVDTDPLQLLLEQIRGASGTAASLGVVTVDPEQKPRADVQDVEAKPKSAPGAQPTRWRAL